MPVTRGQKAKQANEGKKRAAETPATPVDPKSSRRKLQKITTPMPPHPGSPWTKYPIVWAKTPDWNAAQLFRVPGKDVALVVWCPSKNSETEERERTEPSISVMPLANFIFYTEMNTLASRPGENVFAQVLKRDADLIKLCTKSALSLGPGMFYVEQQPLPTQRSILNELITLYEKLMADTLDQAEYEPVFKGFRKGYKLAEQGPEFRSIIANLDAEFPAEELAAKAEDLLNFRTRGPVIDSDNEDVPLPEHNPFSVQRDIFKETMREYITDLQRRVDQLECIVHKHKQGDVEYHLRELEKHIGGDLYKGTDRTAAVSPQSEDSETESDDQRRQHRKPQKTPRPYDSEETETDEELTYAKAWQLSQRKQNPMIQGAATHDNLDKTLKTSHEITKLVYSWVTRDRYCQGVEQPLEAHIERRMTQIKEMSAAIDNAIFDQMTDARTVKFHSMDPVDFEYVVGICSACKKRKTLSMTVHLNSGILQGGTLGQTKWKVGNLCGARLKAYNYYADILDMLKYELDKDKPSTRSNTQAQTEAGSLKEQEADIVHQMEIAEGLWTKAFDVCNKAQNK